MTKYVPRLTQPEKTNKYYNSNINPFVSAGYGMFQHGGNCTCYAFGRRYELEGTKPKLSTANAENWYLKNDGYKRGQTPKVGAVACWRKGEAGQSKDGAGHVAVVEKVYDNGDILVSESGWNQFIFRTKTYTKSSGYAMVSTSYHFQGFIYAPIEYETDPEEVKYVFNCDSLNIRTGAGTNYKMINDLTIGTQVTVYETKNNWSRIGVNQWVSSLYLTSNKPLKIISTKEVTTELNVRTSNSFVGTKNIAKVKCPLPKGTLVSVIKTSGNGVQIGKNRWVYKTYLR